jgi:hypothetical protein
MPRYSKNDVKNLNYSHFNSTNTGSYLICELCKLQPLAPLSQCTFFYCTVPTHILCLYSPVFLCIHHSHPSEEPILVLHLTFILYGCLMVTLNPCFHLVPFIFIFVCCIIVYLNFPVICSIIMASLINSCFVVNGLPPKFN